MLAIKFMWSLVNETEYYDAIKYAGDAQMKSYCAALNEALAFGLRQDPTLFCMGQGINDYNNGYWGITKDLSQQFGVERVFDIPLSEAGMMGVAIGAALAGMHPVYFHNRPDFLWLTMDQLVNHGMKYPYMSGGRCSVPLIIWAATGKGWGSAAQHTQALQAVFMHVPGCRVVMPTTPFDAKGLMLTAIQDRNPVIFLEHRLLLNQEGAVPDELYFIPFGKGVLRRSGNDVTILGISLMVKEAERAADILSERGVSAEVIDLRTIKPWDKELVIQSVKKTGRLIIADTSWRTMGVPAEIASTIHEACFGALKAPVVRLGCADVPTPCSVTLEKAFYVNAEEIADRAIELV